MRGGEPDAGQRWPALFCPGPGLGFGLRLRTDHGCTDALPLLVMHQDSTGGLIRQYVIATNHNRSHPRAAGINYRGSTCAGADEHQRQADEQPQSEHRAPR